MGKTKLKNSHSQDKKDDPWKLENIFKTKTFNRKRKEKVCDKLNILKVSRSFRGQEK